MDANQLLHKLFSFCPAVLDWYRDQTGIPQKVRRLKLLVAKIHSVVEVSEKVEIKSVRLRKWQQKFKDAAIQGDEVLRELDEQANCSSSGFWAIFKKFFTPMENVEKLNSANEWLEQNSTEVKDFLETVNLELSELVNCRRKLKLKPGTDNLKMKEKMEERGGPKGSHPPRIFETAVKNSVGTNMEEKAIKEKVVGPLVKLSGKNIEQVRAVEGLAARIKDSVDQAARKGGDGSWFNKWSSEFEEATKEGSSVASAIKSRQYYVDDKISDEVGSIVTRVRQNLESVYSDLDDFRSLAKTEKMARELRSSSSK